MASPSDGTTRAVTIRDVAAAAEVSIGTASKALNGRGRMRVETRDRVLAAAERLGFRPNPFAQGLLAGRTYTVGLVTSDSFGRFSIPVMLGAEDALDAGQISVFMCDTRDDPIRERHYVERLLARRVEGIIVTGRRTEPRPGIGRDLPVPVVYAMTQSADDSDVSIIPDDEGGGALAARHLMATGRTRIGHVTGPQSFEAARRRAQGMTTALGSAGLAPAGEILYGQWSEEWGRQGADVLLHESPDVDAVFCGSDQIARGVAETLRERGRRVPEDVALVGFDNWEPMALGCRPPLTTVDMNLGEIGRLAARHLLDAIAGDPAPGGVTIVPAGLVLRESTRRGTS
ncbi:LacI family DNA-binding transcriptional regulator [Nonomuraea maritima]|uniref:LacI family DNA-binding transcriptional regulator n=1 Tax=Nonomuraea maritima TaxID=683260 RepID=UPI000B8A0E09|nr:LacI family DNA-binding transcriptional regulator [Nonomuraea maritima]